MSTENYVFNSNEILDVIELDDRTVKIIFLTENDVKTIIVTAERVDYAIYENEQSWNICDAFVFFGRRFAEYTDFIRIGINGKLLNTVNKNIFGMCEGKYYKTFNIMPVN